MYLLRNKKFLETLSRKLNEKRMYVSRYGNRGKPTEEALTRESTIMKLKVEDLVRFCSNGKSYFVSWNENH